MKFQQLLAPDGSVEPGYILFTDSFGRVWVVPQGHRFWDLYQNWLADGNEPLPPA
jgi:hypothetical protein